MKKLIVCLLVFIMVFTVACRSNLPATPTETTPNNEVTPTNSSIKPSGAPVYINEDTSIPGTVRFWIPFSGPQGMDAMIEEFNSVYPNIKVELNTYNNNADGNVAVNTAMIAGEVDVLHSFGLANAYSRWESGLYRDITDAIAADNLDLMAEWGTDVYKYNGRVYTLPAGALSYYVAINMTEWKNAGLGEIPAEWTWDEYLEACKAMTHGEGANKVYGGSDYHSEWYVTLPLSQVTGRGGYYNEDGMSSVDNPVFKKALAREVKAEQVDGIWFPLTSYRADNLQAQMTYLSGKTASTIICNLHRFLRDTETYPVDWVTAFAPYPTEEKGQPNHMEGVSPFSHVGIATNSPEENYEASYAFLKWYSTYGCKYLVLAGHLPSWKHSDVESMVDLIFGENASKLVDVDSFKRVVFNYGGLNWVDVELTAYSEVADLYKEYINYVHSGEMNIDDALAELKEVADEAIRKAKK